MQAEAYRQLTSASPALRPFVAGGIAAISPIRQKHRGTASKLQIEFEEKLRAATPNGTILGEAITLRLANGCTYRPDCWEIGTVKMLDGSFHAHLKAYEVKGPQFWPAAKVKLKVAAEAYPWIAFYLVTKPNWNWQIERVLASC